MVSVVRNGPIHYLKGARRDLTSSLMVLGLNFNFNKTLGY